MFQSTFFNILKDFLNFQFKILSSKKKKKLYKKENANLMKVVFNVFNALNVVDCNCIQSLVTIQLWESCVNQSFRSPRSYCAAHFETEL